jgi:hypothetical protein
MDPGISPGKMGAGCRMILAQPQSETHPAVVAVGFANAQPILQIHEPGAKIIRRAVPKGAKRQSRNRHIRMVFSLDGGRARIAIDGVAET